jgi:hypothetical protein
MPAPSAPTRARSRPSHRRAASRHDVDTTLDDLDVESEILVVALVDRREVPGELRLREPLQLKLHRGELAARLTVLPGPLTAPLGAGVVVVITARGGEEPEGQSDGQQPQQDP